MRLDTTHPDLYLETLVPADTEDLFNAIRANSGHLSPFMNGHVDFMTSRDNVLRFIVGNSSFESFGIWQNPQKEADTKILCGQMTVYHTIRSTSEIGYWVDESKTRQGIASLAVSCVCDYLKDIGKNVTAKVAPNNHASIAVLRRNGFYQEMPGALDKNGHLQFQL